MTQHPSFSIIAPIYGVEKYIVKCADSLLGQTYDDIQFIFVNDGGGNIDPRAYRDIIQVHNSSPLWG